MSGGPLKSKVIVITGASSNVGKGAALKFAAAGAHLVLAIGREEPIGSLVRECESVDARVIAVPTDVCVRADMERLAGSALSEYGRIDVWINNARAESTGRFEEIPLEEHDKVIATDLVGTLYGSYFATQQFREQNSGILINVASAAGKAAAPCSTACTAARYGVVGLSASIRQELRENGIRTIRVCTVLPTPADDPREVADVIVRLATDPEDEVPVGASDQFMNVTLTGNAGT